MKKFIPLVLFLALASLSVAQSKSIFTNAQKIDENRYKEYKGSPMLFDDWQLGNIYNGDELVFEKMEMNINGHTNEIEVKKGNQFVALDGKWYSKIVVDTNDGPRTFERGRHQFFRNNFVEIIYVGEKLSLLRKFRSSMVEKEINDVGKIHKIKRFENRFEYFFIKEDQLKSVKFKKKNILSYLGHKKEMESYLKKNKLKITDDQDIKKVLAYYESQNF